MHPLQMTTAHRLLIAATAVVCCLTGCSDRPPMPDPRAEKMQAEAAKPAMSAEDRFFDGKLLVEANLGRGFGSRGPGGTSGGGERGGAGGHRRVGGGMGLGGGSEGGGRRGGGLGSADETGSGGAGSAIHESNMPPIALRLRLTNTSQETVEVTFLICKSELGDFAVRPEKLVLAPGQSAEPDRMTSRLGLTSDELVLKVGLRLAGKVEQKDLVLTVVPASEPSTDPEPTKNPKSQP